MEHILNYCGIDDNWGRLHLVNRTFREAARQRVLLVALRNFPTYAADSRSWGPAKRLWPYASWQYWEVQILVRIANPRAANYRTWTLWERHWARSLAEVAGIWNTCETTGGWYDRLIIQIEEWEWTYEDGWERVKHL